MAVDPGFKKVDDFINAMAVATSLEDVFAILRVHIEALGYERFAYWLIWPPEGPRKPIYINSYPVDWLEYYTANGMSADDVVMQYASTHVSPYDWQSARGNYELTKPQRIVFSEGAEAGLKSGATVPMKGPGQAQAVFSVSNNQNEEEFAKLFLETRHPLHLLATYAHEKIIGLNIQGKELSNISLTAREVEILKWVSRGKTNWEISVIIEISEATVKRHIDNICFKLTVSNKTHAAAKAITHGLILP